MPQQPRETTAGQPEIDRSRHPPRLPASGPSEVGRIVADSSTAPRAGKRVRRAPDPLMATGRIPHRRLSPRVAGPCQRGRGSCLIVEFQPPGKEKE